MRRVLALAAAAGAAGIALIGKWETRPRPAARPPAERVQAPPAAGAGVAWVLVVLVLIAAMGAGMLWLAARRRGAIAQAAAEAAATVEDEQACGRWHCILYVNGMVVRRGYVDYPARDHIAMGREVVARFLATHGDGLPPDVRVTAKATPARAAAAGTSK